MKLQELIDKGILVDDDGEEGIWQGYIVADDTMLLSTQTYERVNYMHLVNGDRVLMQMEAAPECPINKHINDDLCVDVYRKVVEI